MLGLPSTMAATGSARTGFCNTNETQHDMKQKTNTALDAIDSLLAAMPGEDLQPDEFTAAMFIERAKIQGKSMNMNQAKGLLYRMHQDGKLTMRQVKRGRVIENAYKVNTQHKGA